MKYLEKILTVLFLWPAWIIDRIPGVHMSLERLLSWSFWLCIWLYGAIIVRLLFF